MKALAVLFTIMLSFAYTNCSDYVSYSLQLSVAMIVRVDKNDCCIMQNDQKMQFCIGFMRNVRIGKHQKYIIINVIGAKEGKGRHLQVSRANP
jgi:hypothetical protein